MLYMLQLIRAAAVCNRSYIHLETYIYIHHIYAAAVFNRRNTTDSITHFVFPHFSALFGNLSVIFIISMFYLIRAIASCDRLSATNSIIYFSPPSYLAFFFANWADAFGHRLTAIDLITNDCVQKIQLKTKI